MKAIKLGGIVLFAAALFALGPTVDPFSAHVRPALADHAVDEPRILVLHSYSPTYQWTGDIDRGIRDVLEATGEPYRLAVEYMDTKKINTPEFVASLLASYRVKYPRLEYDLVIVSDNNAFNFVQAHREELFPDTPIVFCGINFLKPETVEGRTDLTGVNEDASIEGSLDIALQLLPETEHLYIIHDQTTTGQVVADKLAEFVDKYQADYDVEIWTGLTFQEVQGRAAATPADSLIYTTIYSQDSAGHFLEHSEMVKGIKRVTDTPVFGTWDFNLSDGIVGGLLTSGYAQGEAAARLAWRVMQGEDINSIPITMESPNVYEFDYPYVIAAGIDPDDLPAGSIVLNRPVGFYEQYWKYIWAGVIFNAMLVLVIVILAANNRLRQRRYLEQKRFGAELKQQVAEKTAILQVHLARFVNLVNSMNEAVLFTDDEGRVVVANQPLLNIFSLHETDRHMLVGIDGTHFLESLTHLWECPHKANSVTVVAMVEGQPMYDVILPMTNGRICSVSYMPVTADSGQHLGNLWVMRDVTEQENAEAIRAQFINIASHQLQTPVTALRWSLEALTADNASSTPDERAVGLQRANDIVKGMADLVATLLSISRIDVGKTRAAPVELNVGNVVDKSVRELEAAAAAKGLELAVDMDKDLAFVVSDASLLKEVCSNLISNAIKYSPDKESIEINLRNQADGILIEVVDRGIGIPKDQQARIGEKFFRASNAEGSEVGGTGLGLYLVRRLLSMLGGRLTFESEADHGSAFRVWLPKNPS